MKHPIQRCAFTLALFAFCGVAAAHPGHADGVLAGVAHPWHGLDHLLAMVGVGLWAAQLGGRARWILPCTFVAAMAAGMAAAMSGYTPPLSEALAAWSVLVIGLLIAFALRAPTALAASCVALFALAHGAAHGSELPQFAAPLAYAGGVLLSTALLHALGLMAGKAAASRRYWLQANGVLIAAGGACVIAL